DVIQFRGRTGAFLEPAQGTASLNILKMARNGLLVELKSALAKARRTNERVRSENVSVRNDAGALSTNLEVVPLKDDGSGARFYLVLFEPTEAERKAKAKDQKGSQAPAGRP